MNLFQLVMKQMRQRALGTWLTMLSVMLGVSLAVAVLLVRRGGDSLFGQKDYGYELIIGKGSPLQLVLNTVYHMDASPGNVPYALYESLANPRHPQAKLAIPIAVGDSYKQRRIIATVPAMFGFNDDGKPIEEPGRVFNYRIGKRFELAKGKVFHPAKFEAVVGSDVPRLAGLSVGDTFQATHGASEPGKNEHVHAETIRVVGVLAPTHTPNDGAIFLPLAVHYSLEEHSEGLKAQARMRGQVPGQPTIPNEVELEPPASAPATTKSSAPDTGGDLLSDDAPAKKEEHKHEEHDHDEKKHAAEEKHEDHDHDHPEEEEHHEHTGGEGHAHEHKGYSVNADGTIVPKLPKDQWVLSAILVKVREFEMEGRMMKNPLILKSFIDASGIAVAVLPADVMSQFLRGTMDDLMLLLLVISALVSIVAAAGILVSIYNSVSARMREIAILRALGATKQRVVTLICLEAGAIGLIGGLIGWALGHAIAAAGSAYMQYRLGQGFDTLAVGWEEPAYLLAVVIVAVLAGLVPAMKAYRTPVATNLVG